MPKTTAIRPACRRRRGRHADINVIRVRTGLLRGLSADMSGAAPAQAMADSGAAPFSHGSLSADNLPLTVDWRTNAVAEVKNQQQV